MSASSVEALNDPAKAGHFVRIIARHKLQTRDRFVFEVEIVPLSQRAFVYVEFDDEAWGWDVLSDLSSIPMSYHPALRALVCRETPFSREGELLPVEVE